MEKRVYKKTGQEISLLGFGLMRMPKIDPQKDDIDYALGQEMIDYAIENGVNYFDTAYPYHGEKSEPFIGHALSKYPRESYLLATKMPSWMLKTPEDAPRIFKIQLERLKTDYIDFYLCHAIGSSVDDYKEKYEKTGAIDYLVGLKEKGIIKNLGFSFHGEYPVLEKLLELRDWDFVQIQANYLDWDTQNAKKLSELLEAKNMPCIIMEPVRGGALATLCEKSVELLKNTEPDSSTASWAMRFAAGIPNVITVLSGMSNMEHVIDNVKTMQNYKPLDESGYKVLGEALAAYLDTGSIPCTSCRYCMDCPFGVDIPGVFGVYNKCASEHKLPLSFGDEKSVRESAEHFMSAYNALDEKSRANHCTNCKKCIELCPQGIKIPEKLRGITRMVQGRE